MHHSKSLRNVRTLHSHTFCSPSADYRSCQIAKHNVRHSARLAGSCAEHRQRTLYIISHTEKPFINMQHNSQTIRTTHMSTHMCGTCRHTFSARRDGPGRRSRRDDNLSRSLARPVWLGPRGGIADCRRVSYYVCGIAEPQHRIAFGRLLVARRCMSRAPNCSASWRRRRRRRCRWRRSVTFRPASHNVGLLARAKRASE